MLCESVNQNLSTNMDKPPLAKTTTTSQIYPNIHKVLNNTINLFFISQCYVMNGMCVSLKCPLSFEIVFTKITLVRRRFYVLTFNVSHQISLPVDRLAANSTKPILISRRIHLVNTLIVDVSTNPFLPVRQTLKSNHIRQCISNLI